MTPRFFKSPSKLRTWFQKNHDRAPELRLGFFKLKSGKASVTYRQALDEALCFGWIDGVRNGIDDESYAIRFTPRKPRSNWSQVNVKRAEELEALGLMHSSGLAAFRARDDARIGAYSYEERYRLDAASETLFRKNKRAWQFFESQPPGYRRLASWWVMSAKKEETRAKRLVVLIDDSASERRIAQLTRPSRKT